MVFSIFSLEEHTNTGDDAGYLGCVFGAAGRGDLLVRPRVLLVGVSQDEGGVLLLRDVHVEANVTLPHDVTGTRVQLDGGQPRVLLHSNQAHTVPSDREDTRQLKIHDVTGPRVQLDGGQP